MTRFGIHSKAGKFRERLFILRDRGRHRRGAAPDRIVRLRVRKQLVEVPFDEVGVDIASSKLGVKDGIEQEGGIGPHRPHFNLVEDCGECADGLDAVFAGPDQLGDHRVVEGRDRVAFLDSGLDAAFVPEIEMSSVPTLGRKPFAGSSA